MSEQRMQRFIYQASLYAIAHEITTYQALVDLRTTAILNGYPKDLWAFVEDCITYEQSQGTDSEMGLTA